MTLLNFDYILNNLNKKERNQFLESYFKRRMDDVDGFIVTVRWVSEYVGLPNKEIAELFNVKKITIDSIVDYEFEPELTALLLYEEE